MHHLPNKTIERAFYVSAVAVALPLAASANWDEWSEMQEEVVSAKHLLSADVTSGMSPVGNVTDLVLTSDGTAVQYILYEVPYPYSFYGAEDGFSTFEGVELESGATARLQVRFAGEESARAPEELELTADEADHRLVSNVLGERLEFENDETREIDDLLIERETGAITHFVVEMNAEALFDVDERTIPADRVSIGEEGSIAASMDIRGVEEIAQEYDPAFL